MPRRSDRSIFPTAEVTRPPYTSSPVSFFRRLSVKSVLTSLSSSTLVSMPNCRTSSPRASEKALSPALLTE